MRLQRWDASLTTSETDALAVEVSSILLSRIRDKGTWSLLDFFIKSGQFLAVSEFAIDTN